MRTLPNGVRFYVSPDSQLKYLMNRFDADLVELARDYVDSESVVWDVGSNCGVFAFSANKAKEVVAIEADPFLVFTLQESVRTNASNVVILAAAISSTNSLQQFSIAARGRATNFLTDRNGTGLTNGLLNSRHDIAGEAGVAPAISAAAVARSTIIVPTLTLDSMLDSFTPPTLIKIDVEGSEIAVLAGAKRLLHEVRPIFYFEAGDGTIEECQRIFAAANYDVKKSAEMNWLAQPK